MVQGVRQPPYALSIWWHHGHNYLWQHGSVYAQAHLYELLQYVVSQSNRAQSTITPPVHPQ
ncbi:unnamed protein product [Sphagnum compactum]